MECKEEHRITGVLERRQWRKDDVRGAMNQASRIYSLADLGVIQGYTKTSITSLLRTRKISTSTFHQTK